MTAVEYLVQELIVPMMYNTDSEEERNAIAAIVTKAREMEDEQLMGKYGEGYDEGIV